MELRLVEPDVALEEVHSLLIELEPGEKLALSRDDGTLILRRQSAVNPEMMARVRRVSERYHTVFERLAQ
ncbi:MAG TPA: hypothetical protein ENJ31_00850 [Anaerolineae bacterium]|nr:hypothetical protein [Anaerolineae bacterium]